MSSNIDNFSAADLLDTSNSTQCLYCILLDTQIKRIKVEIEDQEALRDYYRHRLNHLRRDGHIPAQMIEMIRTRINNHILEIQRLNNELETLEDCMDNHHTLCHDG